MTYSGPVVILLLRYVINRAKFILCSSSFQLALNDTPNATELKSNRRQFRENSSDFACNIQMKRATQDGQSDDHLAGQCPASRYLYPSRNMQH